jgi:hypothetical protein
MAGDLREELTIKNLPSVEMVAGHSGQSVLTLRIHFDRTGRKVLTIEYGLLPSCSVNPPGEKIGMRAGQPFTVQLFQTIQM